MRPIPCLAALIAVLIAAEGCGSDTTKRTVSTAWTRPTALDATSAVVYVLRADVSDPIVSAHVDPSVAASTTIGETTHDHGPADGHVGHLDGPAEDPQTAADPGEQVILDGLVAPLRDGAQFDLSLTLQSGATVQLTVQVASQAPPPSP